MPQKTYYLSDNIIKFVSIQAKKDNRSDSSYLSIILNKEIKFIKSITKREKRKKQNDV